MAFISRSRKFFIDRCLTQALAAQHHEANRASAQVLLCRSKSSIGFFSPDRLKMEQFENYCKGMQSRYSNILDEYKRRVEDQLDDPSTDILYEDCDRYICMLNPDETHKCIRVVERVVNQLARDKEMGLPLDFKDNSPLVALTAIRKCYLHNDIDVALDTFALMTPQKGFATSLQFTLDLLFKSKKYDKCAELAIDALENNKITFGMSWCYELGLIAAYRMNSPEGLNYAVKLFDLVFSSEECKLSLTRKARLQILLGHYCVRQNHLNAALTVIDEIQGNLTKTNIAALNVKVLVELSAGNVNAAVNHLRKYARETEHFIETRRRRKMEQRKAEEDELESGEENKDVSENVAKSDSSRPFIYRDVFFRLRDMLQKTDDDYVRGYLQLISSNYEIIVSQRTLSLVVQGNVLRNYRYTPGTGNSNIQRSRDSSVPPDTVVTESISPIEEEHELESSDPEETENTSAVSTQGTAV